MSALLWTLAFVHATIAVMLGIVGLTNQQAKPWIVIVWFSISLATAITLGKVATWAR